MPAINRRFSGFQAAAVLLPFSLPGRNSGCPWTKRLPSSRPPTATSPSCRASVARARHGNTGDPAADGPNEIKQLNPVFVAYKCIYVNSTRTHLAYVCGPQRPEIELRSSSTGRILLIRVTDRPRPPVRAFDRVDLPSDRRPSRRLPWGRCRRARLADHRFGTIKHRNGTPKTCAGPCRSWPPSHDPGSRPCSATDLTIDRAKINSRFFVRRNVECVQNISSMFSICVFV